MKARFMIENPDNIEATMKITMTVKEWIELKENLGETWPSCRLHQAINSVVIEARKVYYAPDTDALS